MRDVKNFMRKAWSSAAMGTPLRQSMRYIEHDIVMTIGVDAHELWSAYSALSGVPSDARQEINDDGITFTWPSYASKFFAEDGPLSHIFDGYQQRTGQVQMARIVERAIDTMDIAIVEAPTGTGKSLAYLVPGLRYKYTSRDKKPIIVSTSSKTLQGQIMNEDAPLLKSIFPDLTVMTVKGMSNYICERNLKGADIPPDVRAMLDQIETGEIDEIQLHPDHRKAVRHETGNQCRGCDFIYDCRYQTQRRLARWADVIVTNHAFLAIDMAGSRIIPRGSVYIVDEAHKLGQFVRQAAGAQITTNAIKTLETMLVSDQRAAPPFSPYLQAMEESANVDGSLSDTWTCEEGEKLARRLYDLADTIWFEDGIPEDESEAKKASLAARCRSMAERVNSTSKASSMDYCRWVTRDEHGEMIAIEMAPIDIAPIIRKALQYISDDACYLCGSVAESRYVEGGHIFCESCAGAGAMADDGKQTDRVPHSPAWIFTSATLAESQMGESSFHEFRATMGIPHSLEAVVESPFDYASTTMLYIADDLPIPVMGSDEHARTAAERTFKLVAASKGGALLLYASRNAMQIAHDELRARFVGLNLNVITQDDLPKSDIIAEMKADPHCVVFGLASFREGVDIPGLNLRLVVLDKLFFEAPNPYSKARTRVATEKAAATGMSGDELKFHAFNTITIPEMIREMQQGAGRLNRRTTDCGIIAIMDPRASARRYGRSRLIPSLPPATEADLGTAEIYLGTLAHEAEGAPQNTTLLDDLDI